MFHAFARRDVPKRRNHGGTVSTPFPYKVLHATLDPTLKETGVGKDRTMKHPHQTAQTAVQRRRVRAHDDPAVTFVMWLYLGVLLMPLGRLLWQLAS
jgi:hypothetical protein